MLKPSWRTDPLAEPARFRAALVKWFEREGKDYPWRRTRDPYAVLVSEVMLQQTQIATVLGRGFYTRFMERFPDTRTLAAADDDPLLKTWEGLGYYRRARMLRETARCVENEHDGRFPEDLETLLSLPGVGPYTAAAVMSFAFDRPAALVDGNVARVLSRVMNFREPVDTGPAKKQLWQWADELLDRCRPRAYNSSLMELGQTHCRPAQPDCLACPVAACCRTPDPAELPRKAKKIPITERDEHVIYARSRGSILLKKLGAGRRSGMWRLPERSAGEVADWPVVHRSKYGITRYRVTLHVHRVDGAVPLQAGESWQAPEDIEELAMPPADRAALRAVRDDAEEIA